MSDMDLVAEREKITKQIKNLERILDPNIATIEVVVSDSNLDSTSEADSLEDDDWDEHIPMEEESWGESDEDDSKDQALPKDPETCLQLNMVYQEVLQEKIAEIDLLLAQNKEQQEEVMWDLSGSKAPKSKDGKSLPSNVFVGHFMKPYFKDKVTGIGPPANEDTREKATQGIKSFEELIVTKWKTWEKTLLRKSVISDHLQRLLQPKLLKLEYLNQKLDKVSDSVEKQILEKQIKNTEKEIEDINQLPEESLLGDRLDERDWEKISNINFEGSRSADEIRKFWQNCEHPSINKQVWVEEETTRLKEIAAKHNYLEWQKIAAELGTNRSAFQCLQMYQQYNKDLKRKEWTKEEDHMLTQLVEEMRVGNHIPYRKIVYYMEGRDSMQLIYRWTKSLNPSLKKGFWTPEEDAKLLQAVAKYGERDWFKIREEVPGRSDAQCRDRYLRRLHFSLKKGRWNAKEEEKLIELIEKYGAGHWAKIASELPHRTGSQCLSKWKALIRKKKRPRKRQKSRKKCSSCSSSSSSSSEDTQLEWHNDLEKEKDAEGALDEYHYTVPSIDLWMPTRHSHSQPCKDPGWSYSRPSSISPCLSKPSGTCKDSNKTIPSAAVATRRDLSQDKDTLAPTMDMECIAHSADTCLEKPQEGLEEVSKTGKHVLKVPLNDVKKVIRINTCLEYQKLKERLKKTHLFNSSLASKIDNGMAIEKVVQVWHKTFLNRQRQQKVGIQRKKLDRKLLMAVTPWVGDIVIPCWSSRKAVTVQTRAEAIMTKLQTIHLTSTPVFTLFIQLLQIDTDGCMKVIGERKNKQSELLLAITGNPQQPQQASSSLQKSSGRLLMKGVGKETQRKSISKMKDLPESAQPGPAVLPTSFGPISKPKTVSELLREKRLRESRARKAMESTVILAPQVLITPPVILQQSLQPLIPSTLAMTQPLGSGSAGKPVTVTSSPVATFQTPSPIIASTKSPEKSSSTNNSGSSQGNEVITEEKVNEAEGTSTSQVGTLISGQSSSSTRAEGHSVSSESPVPATAANPVLEISQISTNSGPGSLLSSQATTTSKKQELPNAAPLLAPSQVSMQQPKPINLVPALSVPTCGPQVISSNIFPITWVVTTQGLVPMSMSTFVGLPGPGKPAGTPVLPILGGVARNQATLKPLPSSIVKQSSRTPEPSPTLAKRPLIASKTLTGDLPSGIDGPNLPTHLPTTASSNTGNHSGKNSLPEDKLSPREVKTTKEMSAPLPQPETQPQTKSPTNQPRTEPNGWDCAPTLEAENDRANPAGMTIRGQDPMQKSLVLETKDHLPVQNGNPGKSFPILTEISKPITQQQEGLAVQDNQPKALEPGKSILDLNLLSLENEASIREWLKGKQGVCLPPLQSTLPYLPPFLCNLKTLSGLLLQKKSLEQKAAAIVAQGSGQDKSDVSRQDVQAARHLVQQQLKENPAYLLLKARFLAAFAFPAFLATLPPPRVPTTLSQTLDRNSGSEEEKEEEECSQSKTRPKDRDCGEKEQLVSTAGETQSTPEAVASIQVSPHPDPHATSSALDDADFNVLKTRNAVHARKRRRV